MNDDWLYFANFNWQGNMFDENEEYAKRISVTDLLIDNDHYYVLDNIDGVIHHISDVCNEDYDTICFVYRFKNRNVLIRELVFNTDIFLEPGLYKVYSASCAGIKDITNLVNFA